MRNPTALLLVTALVCWSFGCSKKAGDECSIGTNQCLENGTMLSCDTGRFVAVQCAGPGGCLDPAGASPICDFSTNVDGARCSRNDNKKSRCREDGKSQITCVDGTLMVEPCRGVGACSESTDGSVCAKDLAKVGDKCSPKYEDWYACEAEGTNQLKCSKGAFVVSEKCKRCDFAQHTATCHSDSILPEIH